MAFFSLTSFGPQNVFEAESLRSTHFHVFKDDDFSLAWKATVKIEEKQIDYYSVVYRVLKKLYNGPIPVNDRIKIDESFEEYLKISQRVSYSDFIEIMKLLKAQNELEIKTSIKKKISEKSSSNHEYRAELQKHIRKNDYKSVQKRPLSANQEVGWENHSYKPPIAGKFSSDITKFATELIKNGVYY